MSRLTSLFGSHDEPIMPAIRLTVYFQGRWFGHGVLWTTSKSPCAFTGARNAKAAQLRGFVVAGGPTRTRTVDQRIMSSNTAALGFIGLREKTVQYVKVQGNQYVSERCVTGEKLRAVPIVYLGMWRASHRGSGVLVGAGVHAAG